MDNSNYDHFHVGGDISHAYVIMHKYFGKKPKMQKMNSWVFISTTWHVLLHENFLNMLTTFGDTNSKPSEYKK